MHCLRRTDTHTHTQQDEPHFSPGLGVMLTKGSIIYRQRKKSNPEDAIHHHEPEVCQTQFFLQGHSDLIKIKISSSWIPIFLLSLFC